MSDLIIGRRGFVAGLASALAAPVIIPYARLMPIKVMKPLIKPVTTIIHPTLLGDWDRYLVQAIDVTGETVLSFVSPVDGITAREVMEKAIKRHSSYLMAMGLPALDSNLVIRIDPHDFPLVAGEIGSYNCITFRES